MSLNMKRLDDDVVKLTRTQIFLTGFVLNNLIA